MSRALRPLGQVASWHTLRLSNPAQNLARRLARIRNSAPPSGSYRPRIEPPWKLWPISRWPDRDPPLRGPVFAIRPRGRNDESCVTMFGRNSGHVIGDRDQSLAAQLGDADRDRRSGGPVLDGVVDDVDELASSRRNRPRLVAPLPASAAIDDFSDSADRGCPRLTSGCGRWGPTLDSLACARYRRERGTAGCRRAA